MLDIVQRLGRLIENRLGAEVIYTRKDDSYLALEKRAEIANLARANLFVSIHANYSDYPSARGVETYYTNEYSSVKARTEDADEAAGAGLQSINWTNVDIREKVHESRRVAASVQRALYAMLTAKNPGLRNRGVKEAHYVVLTGTSMPAILAGSFLRQQSHRRKQFAELRLPPADCRSPLHWNRSLPSVQSQHKDGQLRGKTNRKIRLPIFHPGICLGPACQFDGSEIRTVLQVPEGTVKSKIDRGRIKLARVLQEMGVRPA